MARRISSHALKEVVPQCARHNSLQALEVVTSRFNQLAALWEAAQVELMACAKYGTSSLLTMKPGVSLQLTGCLPMSSTHCLQASKILGSVASVRMTSTSFMSCTGLKKCSPTTCDARPEEPAKSEMASDDVLEARMAEGLATLPRLA
ncbi:unnamed protein product [Phytophthora lilii]|uniref:Unnamed protein product n=1 Tax=Phytophthora lilii TaxID=2077276 RepID=A0A9W6YJI8_9STRA|nr:unnamed protein product [Phytophthora lilii]